MNCLLSSSYNANRILILHLFKIFREVTKVLEEKNLNKLPSYEFIELCGRIEMQGVFTIKRKQKTAIDWCHKVYFFLFITLALTLKCLCKKTVIAVK